MSDLRTEIRKVQDESKATGVLLDGHIRAIQAMLEDPSIPEPEKDAFRAELSILMAQWQKRADAKCAKNGRTD